MLVLPAMKAIRHSTLQKAVAFRRAGGVVVAVGALPEASDRIGREDPEVAAMAREIGLTDDLFARLPGRDYEGPGQVQHRKIGQLDLYAIYGAPKDAEATFRVTGKVELWDPWTGTSRPLAFTSQDADVTTLKLPLTEKEIQLIVFSPGQPDRAPLTTNNQQRTTLSITGSTPEALDFISKTVIFNPMKRLTIDEAISHPYLSKVRDVKREVLSKEPVKMEFEKEGELSAKRLRELFVDEIRIYHPKK